MLTTLPWLNRSSPWGLLRQLLWTAFENFKDEDTTAFLSSLFPRSFKFIGKKYFLLFRRNLLCFSSCPHNLSSRGKSLDLLSLHPLFSSMYFSQNFWVEQTEISQPFLFSVPFSGPPSDSISKNMHSSLVLNFPKMDMVPSLIPRQRGNIICFSLLATILLTHSRILLALFEARAHCYLMFNLVSTRIWISFSSEPGWVSHKSSVQGYCRLTGVTAFRSGWDFAGCGARLFGVAQMLWRDVVKMSHTHPKKCLGKGLKVRGMGWVSG